MMVTLKGEEFEHAAIVGVRRQVYNLRDGRKDTHGFTGDGWGVHVEGACAEYAAAKALGVDWPGSSRYEGAVPDIGGRYDVRWSPPKDRYPESLILHPKDVDARPYILVVGRAPTFELVGWLRARDGKVDEFWSDPTRQQRWAFFVPRRVLRHMVDLP